jgi:hypothetical protein
MSAPVLVVFGQQPPPCTRSRRVGERCSPGRPPSLLLTLLSFLWG